jgi:hypothetical protein
MTSAHQFLRNKRKGNLSEYVFSKCPIPRSCGTVLFRRVFILTFGRPL